jgi:hypothetical protein
MRTAVGLVNLKELVSSSSDVPVEEDDFTMNARAGLTAAGNVSVGFWFEGHGPPNACTRMPAGSSAVCQLTVALCEVRSRVQCSSVCELIQHVTKWGP